MALLLAPADLARVTAHAERLYPEECCGFLFGREQPPETVVEAVREAPNERAEHRRTRYLIAPETVLDAHREARDRGLSIVGYYHSHPDHPAEPGAFDREHAWPAVSYLIVPVHGGRAGGCRSWRLRADGGGFDPESLQPSASAAENAGDEHLGSGLGPRNPGH